MASRRFIALAVLAASFSVLSGCNDLEKPKSDPYYSGTTPPRKQEFRWSNGKMPKSLDPSKAAAPPETDLVRAVFEGLTEIDARTLKEQPAAAEKWTSSDDFKTWTFTLRAEARWSNGKPVVAEDFVHSWRRLGELGNTVAHPDLLTNIVGFPVRKKEAEVPSTDFLPDAAPGTPQAIPSSPPANSNQADERSIDTAQEPGPAPASFGVSAPDARTLRVLLLAPDKDFPKLVAHPMFRPIFGSGGDLAAPINPSAVTNGAFRIEQVDASGVRLTKSDTYWNRDAVKLDRVTLVPAENAEQALAAYKAGEIDAVTNADFEPLAVKLLEPFEDFRRRTHAAINFYEINHEKSPFDDRRVREALAISLERERLTEGEMGGFTQPALSFLPFGSNAETKIAQDKERARDLLDEAGFPNGENFPVVNLVVNRNDTQQRVARAVARMWKQNLNVDTEIVVKENAELDKVREAGDFDMIRRGVVFPSADELMSILSILKPAKQSAPRAQSETGVEARDPQPNPAGDADAVTTPSIESPDVTMSESNAIYELWAIPLYFPTSYSLVKPYVSGFEINSLDAPSLVDVAIDSNWQPK